MFKRTGKTMDKNSQKFAVTISSSFLLTCFIPSLDLPSHCSNQPAFPKFLDLDRLQFYIQLRLLPGIECSHMFQFPFRIPFPGTVGTNNIEAPQQTSENNTHFHV
jgi:hypothetical protein